MRSLVTGGARRPGQHGDTTHTPITFHTRQDRYLVHDTGVSRSSVSFFKY